MKPVPSLFALFLCTALAGCAAGAGGPDDWQSSPKHGWVAEMYDATTPAEHIPACLAGIPASELAQHHYVRLRYHHLRAMHTEVAELPPGVSAQLGDMVELWPADCAKGALSRIIRVVPAAP